VLRAFVFRIGLRPNDLYAHAQYRLYAVKVT